MQTAFYEADGDGFMPTVLTRGPWDPGSQHAGPPAGLLGRAIEQLPDGDGMQVVRVTLEILRPVPMVPLTVEAALRRPGRRVQLCEAVLRAGGEDLVRATGWRMRVTDIGVSSQPPGAPPAGPEAGTEQPFFETGQEIGYHTAMECRFLEGSFTQPGPATVWLRMRVPLVAGETSSPLQRVLVAADTGNGVSGALDYSRWVFINPDLTVSLHRLPAGEWICLDAHTVVQPHGIGGAHSVLWDRKGLIGWGLQTLFVAPR